MCDPITLILGAASAAAGAMSLSSSQQAAPPPTPTLPPAISAPTNSVKQTEVKLGSDDGPASVTKENSSSDVFQRRRLSANSFGNLGKSALSI